MPDGERGFNDRVLSTTKKSIRCSIEIKSFDAAQGVITGIATTPTPDRAKDRLNPIGFRFAKSIPLFLYHDSTKSVGRAFLGKATAKGIPFEARLPNVTEEGVLRDRVEEARQMVKYGLIDAVSVGFNPDDGEYKRNDIGGIDFDAGEILELSLVPIPMQPEALIQHIKSFAAAAPGRKSAERPPPPGASGPSKPPFGGFFSPQGKGTNVKTMEMQVQDLRATRDTNAKRMEELLELKQNESRQFTDDERSEFDGLKASITDLDDAISVKSAMSVEIRSARPIEPAVAQRGSTYGFVRRQDPDDKFKGQSETRRIIARALSHISMKQGEFKSASRIAEERYGRTHPNLVAVMKSGVTGGGSGSGETWAELVAMDGRFTGDFVEFLYSRTIYDQLGLRDVPANVTIKGQDGAATGYFVGESKGIPVSAGSGSTVNLTPLKVAAISVSSNELLADSSPAAEMLIRDSLVQAASQKTDTVFLSTSAASAGVSPAGILNGLSAGGSAGNTPAHVMADLQGLLANFISGKYSGELVIVTTPTNAAALGMMTNSLGFPAFPNSQITQKGGTFQGYRVVTGHNLTANYVLMLSPMDIWKIGDSGVQVSVSQEAMIEQDTAPAGATDTPSAATATLTSMFQEESTAFKIVRRINWQKRRSDAVAYISDASYSLGS